MNKRITPTPPEKLWIDTCIAYIKERHAGSVADGKNHVKSANSALDAFLERFPEWKEGKADK